MMGVSPLQASRARGRGPFLGALGAYGACLALAGSALATETWRADHMVLDAILAGDQVVVATQSGRVVALAEGAAARELLVIEVPEGQAMPPVVAALALAPSGRTIAAASTDGLLRFIDLDGRLIRTLERPGLAPIQAAVFLDEHLLLLGDLRGELALLDLRTDTEAYRRQLEYDPVYALALDPSGERAALGFRSSRIHVVDVRTGATLTRLDGHTEAVLGLAWLDGNTLVSGGKDKTLRRWDVEAGSHVQLHRGDAWVTAVVADPGRGLMAFSTDDDAVIVADASGPITTLTGHTAPVQVLRFLADGRLLSTGYDARVFLRDVPAAQEGSTSP